MWQMTGDLPLLALSVRQPWAWAIVAGHKRIENRTEGSIRAGRMDLRRIALHAASGMREKEYAWAVWRMAQIGVEVPPPSELPRRAIVGAVDVTGIISESDSPWFGGPRGLMLERAETCAPIPCSGALGYFEWSEGGALAPSPKWMGKYEAINGDYQTGSLFDTLEPSFAAPPPKPFARSKKEGAPRSQQRPAPRGDHR